MQLRRICIGQSKPLIARNIYGAGSVYYTRVFRFIHIFFNFEIYDGCNNLPTTGTANAPKKKTMIFFCDRRDKYAHVRPYYLYIHIVHYCGHHNTTGGISRDTMQTTHTAVCLFIKTVVRAVDIPPSE